jgi:hypothetical protein
MPQQITGGVGNSGNVTYYSSIKVEIGELAGDPNNLAFTAKVSFDTYAGFTNGLEAQGIGLLGQSGFFESFAVAFDHAARQFHIDAPDG